MTENREFCDCYHLSYHPDEYVPYPCDFCEKMERIYEEETEKKETGHVDEESHMAANF